MKRKWVVVVWVGVVLLISLGCQMMAREVDAVIPNTGKADTQMPPTTQSSATAQEVVDTPDVQQTAEVESATCRTSGASAKSIDLGGRLYSFYCAGCHGRQGQGYPTGFFPPLLDTPLAVSDNIEPSLHVMMNTDIHPMASLLFESDALAVINYIRVTFAHNPSAICPGDVKIEINP